MYKEENREGREPMRKEEFEDLIGQALSNGDYEIIETVYRYHPAIRGTSGVEELAELYKSFGMTIFYDMIGRAKRNQDLDGQLRQAQAKTDRIKEEIVQNRASMGLDYSRMLDKLADEASQPSQSETDGLQRVEITTRKDISGMFTQVAVDGHVIPYVRGYKLEHVAGKPPVLSLDLNGLDLYIDEPMALRHKGLDENIEVRIKREEFTTDAADPLQPVTVSSKDVSELDKDKMEPPEYLEERKNPRDIASKVVDLFNTECTDGFSLTDAREIFSIIEEHMAELKIQLSDT